MREIEAIALGKEIRQPEQEHPPNGINQKSGKRVRPRLGYAQERAPGHVGHGERTARICGRVAVDKSQLAGAYLGMFLRSSIDPKPKDQPDQAERTGHDESCAPSPSISDERHD